MSKRTKSSPGKRRAKKRIRGAGEDETEAADETVSPFSNPLKTASAMANDIYKMNIVKPNFELLVQTSSFKKLEEFIFEKFNEGTFKWVGKKKAMEKIPKPIKRFPVALRSKVIFQKFVADVITEAMKEVAEATESSGVKTLSWSNPEVMKTNTARRMSFLQQIYGDDFIPALDLVVARKKQLKDLIAEQSDGMKKDKEFLVGTAAYIGLLIIDLMYSATRLAIGAKQKKVHEGLAAEVVRIKAMEF